MNRPMLKCGHAAMATNAQGKPSCPMCIGIRAGAEEIDPNPPNLDGRIAYCSSCAKERPSRADLPFFEFGRFNKGTHDMSQDSYYCGCAGWD